MPLWRSLAAIVLTVAGTALLIYGSVMLTAKAAISNRMIREVVAEMDLMKEYGEDTAKAINVGIMHLTDSAFTERLYLSPKQLPQYLDEGQIKSFLIDKVSAFSSALTSGSQAGLEARELVAFFDRVRDHVRQETGIEITEAAAEAEVEQAIGAAAWSLEGHQIIHSGRAVACIVLGALLLIGVYLAAWPKFLLSSLLCAMGCVLLCLTLRVTGGSLQRVFDMTELISTFGSGAFSLWIGKVSALFIQRSHVALIGLFVPIVVTVAYIIDSNHIARLESSRGRY